MNIANVDTKLEQNSVNLINNVYQVVANYLKTNKNSSLSNLHAMLLNEVEPPMLQALMEHTGYNQSKTALLLGLSRSTTRKKLQQYFGDKYFPQTALEDEE